MFACAVEVGAATESLVVPRCSALGAGSFVDRGQIDAFASLLVGTATDVGVFIVCKGGGLRSTRTAAGVYQFAVLPLASLFRCLRASSDNVVIVVEPDFHGPAGGCACFGPTGSVADGSHPRVLSASVRGGWQMCTLVWGGLEGCVFVSGWLRGCFRCMGPALRTPVVCLGNKVVQGQAVSQRCFVCA